MTSSTASTATAAPAPGAALRRLREARLRPGKADLYPGIRPGEWRTAASLADQVLAGQLLRGLGTAVRGRVLPEAHFEFRGGVTVGGEREGMRPQRARV
jgi:hypothetical protein